jgi:hypothetical protein
MNQVQTPVVVCSVWFGIGLLKEISLKRFDEGKMESQMKINFSLKKALKQRLQ